ncbi:MAG: hypothetical protein JXR76_20875 [Deltaproteobacteria bacterium]|nr:hypothetical protein [Deltaproteobacteria bacterium]
MRERNSKILLVSVPERIQNLFESQRANYSVSVAETIDRALSQIERENIQLCVLSDDLPDMESFIREVRNTPWAAELPLLVITKQKTHEELFKLGADAFLGATESDLKFLEKIELLLGLSDSNNSNVFSRRKEPENPFYFALQHASKLVSGKDDITPVDHVHILENAESLQALIRDVDKEIRGNDNKSNIVQEITEGLESVDPQGYIGHQLSRGERFDNSPRDVTFYSPTASSMPPESISGSSELVELSGDNFSTSPGSTNENGDDIETAPTDIFLKGLKHRTRTENTGSPLAGNRWLDKEDTIPPYGDSASRDESADTVSERITKSINVESTSETLAHRNSNVVYNELQSAPNDPSRSIHGNPSFASTPSRSSVSMEPLSHAVGLKLVRSTGKLVDSPLWDICAQIFYTRFSGELRVQRDEVERVFHFANGELMVVASNSRDDRLVELLYREGRLSDEQYESASDTIAASGRRAGVVMVEKGIISSRELFPVVRFHYENIFYDTFLWQNGEWVAIEKAYTLTERIVMDVPFISVLYDAVRMVISSEQVDWLIDDECILKKKMVSKDQLELLTLDVHTHRMLERIDGTKTVATLATQLGVSLMELKKVVAGMTVIGVLKRDIVSFDFEKIHRSQPDRIGLDSRRMAPARSHVAPGIEDNASILEEKLKQIEDGTYFDIVDVDPGASLYEIKQSLARLKKTFSAESFAGVQISDLQEKLSIIGSVLDEAADVLFRDEIREQYRRAIL